MDDDVKLHFRMNETLHVGLALPIQRHGYRLPGVLHVAPELRAGLGKSGCA